MAMSGGLRSLRRLWSGASRLVRTVVVVLLCQGVILTVTGLLLDIFKVWDSSPFVVNLASSAASTCFSIPIALVVPRYLLEQQQDRSEQAKFQRLALNAIDRVHSLANEVILDWPTCNSAVEVLEEAISVYKTHLGWLIGPKSLLMTRFAAGRIRSARGLGCV